MEMIKMQAIQDYYGQDTNGLNWFIWDQIIVPKDKEKYVYLMNQAIPKLFKLSEATRTRMINGIILMNYNNGIDQYFPFLKDYASEEVKNFIYMANGTDTMNIQQNQKAK